MNMNEDHARDQYRRVIGQSINAAVSSIELLNEARHANGKGKSAVVEDHLDRVVTELTNLVRKLRNAPYLGE